MSGRRIQVLGDMRQLLVLSVGEEGVGFGGELDVKSEDARLGRR